MELPLWQVLILAVVQGVAEFLPISSSGHVVVLGHLMHGSGSEPPDIGDLNIVLHLGTLGSIVVYYWSRILRLLGADRRIIGMLILATVPAVLVGLPLKLFAENLLESPWIAGLMFPVSGLALLWLSRSSAGNVEYPQMTTRQALWIGISQAAAILPGLSRSGSTITTGVTTGLTRNSAAAFSFLMAVPVIAGAGLLQAIDFFKDGKLSTPITYLVLGALVAFLTGLGTLWVLNKWLEKGRLHIFAWYCIILGIVVLGWQTSLWLQTAPEPEVASETPAVVKTPHDALDESNPGR